MLDPHDHWCGFCSRKMPPEGLFRVEVRYLGSAHEVCRDCRDELAAGGRFLSPFEPELRVDPRFRWPGVLPGDVRAALAAAREELGSKGREIVDPPLEAAKARAALGGGPDGARWGKLEFAGEADLAAALATAAIAGEELGPLEKVERAVLKLATADATSLLLGIYAHATAGVTLADAEAPPVPGAARPPLSRAAEASLDVAAREYVSFGKYLPANELDARVLALSIALRVARGKVEDADRALRQLLTTAATRPVARDPRLPLLEALLAVRATNLDAADRALSRAVEWCDAAPQPGDWADVKAAALHDRYVRAAQASAWPRARDALRDYLRLRPGDRAARLDLGHAYVKSSLEAVAREVLESALDAEAQAHIRSHYDEDPHDRAARLVYGTSLLRLGDAAAAWGLLRDVVERDGPEDALRAGELHLAGLAARALGKLDAAVDLVAAAYALEARTDRRSRRTRADLCCLLHEQLADQLDALCAERFAGLLEWLQRHGEVLREELTPVGADLLVGFVAAEAQRKFAAVPGFGPDPIDRARFAHVYAMQLQAYFFLAKRRLDEAVRCDREARRAGASPIPIALLLRFLALYQADFDAAPFRFEAA